MPRHVYANVKQDLGDDYRTRPVVVQLSNVSGAERYRGVLLTLTGSLVSSEPELRWERPPDRLQNTSLQLKTRPLVDCTLEIEFNIEDKESGNAKDWLDRKSTRLNSSHVSESRMPS